MNIIEAINQAIKEKRNIYAYFAWSHTSNFGNLGSTTSTLPGTVNPEYLLGIIGNIDRISLLRTDWELEEKSVTITLSQFNSAVSRMQSCRLYSNVLGAQQDVKIWNITEIGAKDLANELGLYGEDHANCNASVQATRRE